MCGADIWILAEIRRSRCSALRTGFMVNNGNILKLCNLKDKNAP